MKIYKEIEYITNYQYLRRKNAPGSGIVLSSVFKDKWLKKWNTESGNTGPDPTQLCFQLVKGTKNTLGAGVVGHTSNSSTGKAKAGRSEFQSCLVYRATFRIPEFMQQRTES